MSIVLEIKAQLDSFKDEKYKKFQSKLIPTIDSTKMIGVRTPILRQLAKKYINDPEINLFLNDVPHQTFDENQLHVMIVSLIKDYNQCIELTNQFLPYIDNWATCDQFSPKIFKKYKEELLFEIRKWLNSNEPYTIRFGIKLLMEHYLEQDFKPLYLKEVAAIKHEHYYVNMMLAWYFATALAKQPDDTIMIFEQEKLEKWTHNKSIQKAIESYRVSDELKSYLRTLKIK